MGIGEVAERSGVTASTIRYYERAGLLPAPPRLSGRRSYGPDVLDRLALIDLAKRAGFTIAEIRRLVSGLSKRASPGARWRRLAAAKRDELDARIDEARRMRRVLDRLSVCECPSFDDCADLFRKRTDAT